MDLRTDPAPSVDRAVEPERLDALDATIVGDPTQGNIIITESGDIPLGRYWPKNAGLKLARLSPGSAAAIIG